MRVLCASGMGITTYTAARILKGQLLNQTGEETVMTMDTFPNVGLAKVHSDHSCSCFFVGFALHSSNNIFYMSP